MLAEVVLHGGGDQPVHLDALEGVVLTVALFVVLYLLTRVRG